MQYMPTSIEHPSRLFLVPAFISSRVSDDFEHFFSVSGFMFIHSLINSCLRGYSENDRTCSVCNSKNAQLVDALRAQSESRGQHEAFHNLLERSVEPFSVITEYFSRGMFNEIVLVDEEDDAVVEVRVLQH